MRASYVTSISDLKDIPNTKYLECAIIGKSNVGKSSLINYLAQQKIAFTSKFSGRTLSLNYYLFESFYLVDTPGLGHSINIRVGDYINQLLSDYLSSSKKLRAIIYLLDSRRELDELDLDIANELLATNLPLIVLGSKYDKATNQEKSYFDNKVKDVFKQDNVYFGHVSSLKKTSSINILGLAKKLLDKKTN
jgi:GTP-binding protein